MAVKEPNTPVVHQDLVPYAVWLMALAKALIHRKVLPKDDIIAELRTIQAAGSTAELEADIERMINTVNGW